MLDSLDRSRSLTAGIGNLPGLRDADAYTTVVKQFSVESNPRYAPLRTQYTTTDPLTGETASKVRTTTYCNIFLGDATKAMGCEVPHWVLSTPPARKGEPAKPFTVGAIETTANLLAQWMLDYGSRKLAPGAGWRQTSAQAAQSRANDGFPTVALWAAPPGGGAGGEPGHAAVVVPGDFSSASGVAIAQAGGRCFWGRYNQGFGARVALYWTHD